MVCVYIGMYRRTEEVIYRWLHTNVLPSSFNVDVEPGFNQHSKGNLDVRIADPDFFSPSADP